MSTSFLCAIASDLAMVQIVRRALGLGEPVADTMVEYCGFNHRTVVSPLKRNPDCPTEHIAYRKVLSPQSVSEFTLRHVAKTAGFGDWAEFGSLSFKIGEFAFCNMWACKCSMSRLLERFISPGGSAEECTVCGESIRPLPFYTHYPVPGSAIGAVLDRHLQDLGADSADWAVVCGPNGSVLLYTSSEGGKYGVSNE